MRGEFTCERLAFAGITRFGVYRALVTRLILARHARKRIIEPVNKTRAEAAAIGRFVIHHLRHVLTPVLIAASIAAHTDRMRRAEHGRQLCGIFKIIRPAHRHIALRHACARGEECAKNYGMKELLLHEASFARLAARLKRFEQQIDVIIQKSDGSFARGVSGEAVASPQPALAYGSAEAFYSPHVQGFLKAVMTSPDLDWFQSVAAGIEHPVLAGIGRAAKRYTTNHRQAESMAEWALWQALDFFRAGPAHRALQDEGRWKRTGAREMQGSRWLIVGYGAIGEQVGTRVAALGGVVTGVKRSGGEAPGAARLIKPDQISSDLPNADVVLLCTPHTPQTESMANAAFFAAMKPDALFLNLGRGALVDEDALIAALDSGRPAFAALDVVRTEPLPATSPLWRHPKIAITPHDSSETLGTTLRADETFMENLERYVSGAPLKHLVDRSAFGA